MGVVWMWNVQRSTQNKITATVILTLLLQGTAGFVLLRLKMEGSFFIFYSSLQFLQVLEQFVQFNSNLFNLVRFNIVSFHSSAKNTKNTLSNKTKLVGYSSFRRRQPERLFRELVTSFKQQFQNDIFKSFFHKYLRISQQTN